MYCNLPCGRDSIQEIDAAVGAIMKAVKDQGALDNTIVWFTSDNGPRGGPVGTNQIGNSGPFRGFKGTIFEGGWRVPSIVYWHKKIPRKKVMEITSSLDIYNTLMRLSGSREIGENDGLDISHLLLNSSDSKENRPERSVFLYYFRDSQSGRSSAVRHQQYKLITQTDLTPLPKPLLYNLELDPGEAVDLYDVGEFRKVRDDILALKEAEEAAVVWSRKVVLAKDPSAMPCCSPGCHSKTHLLPLRNCCRC